MTQPLLPLEFPLHGSRLIEASAGTGKTYTIAMLYLRLVLQHGGEQAFERALMPPEILVVTFTDAATQELRDRIRQRLNQAAQVFDGADSEDPLLAALRDDYEAERWPACARRLRLAAEWMDEAAVSTIHSWCYRMLREHAFDSGSLFRQELVTDDTELLTEAVQDYWRRHAYPLPLAAARAVRRCYRGPQELQAALRPLLPRADAELRYDDAPLADGDIFDALARHAEELQKSEQLAQAARDLWSKNHLELANTLRELLPFLNGAIYRNKDREGEFDGWMQAMRAWSEGGEPPDNIKRWGQAGIKTKGGHPVPQHPAFGAIDDWLASEPGKEVLDQLQAQLLRHALAEVRTAVQGEKRRRAELGFDDLLTRLDAALEQEARRGSDALAVRIRRQFPVAMIDEFQDTDPLQYRIFERIYRLRDNSADNALLLIGDPKQAIYAFRGADIHTYLRARAATAPRHYALSTNYRSTAGMVDAVNHCFAQAEGYPQGAFRFAGEHGNPVPFVPVAARGRKRRWLRNGEAAAALTLWWMAPEEQTPVRPAGYREHLAQAAASEVVRWLHEARQGRTGFADAEGDLVPLRPADIAVLVRSRAEAEAMREALARRGLASVYLSDRDSVFATPEAAELQHWLAACAHPGDDGALRRALATACMGWHWNELERLNTDEAFWEAQTLRMRELHSVWQRHGPLPMLRQWLAAYGLPARWLQEPGGERRLTNMLHLAEWLQRQSGQLDGEHALLRVYAEQLEGQGRDEDIVRLESDAELIQIVTIHKSKGLEYPLVLLPFICSWRDYRGNTGGYPQFHDGDGDQLVVQLNRSNADAVQRHNDERLAEDLRLLYVALTRAQYATWLGIAPLASGPAKANQLERSAIGYLLAGGSAVPDAELPEQLRQWAAGCAGMALEPAPAINTDAYQSPAPPPLAPARSARHARRPHWWIASFSALTEKLLPRTAESLDGQAQDAMLLEPETAGQDQYLELADTAVPLDEDDETAAIVPPAPDSVHAFAKGADAGNFLHGLLEWCGSQGFAQVAADPQGLQHLVDRRCLVRGWQDWAAPLQQWLLGWLTQPLRLPQPSQAGQPLSLSGLLQGRDYQVEMEFWLPIAQASSGALDALVQRHIAPGQPRPALAPNQLNGMLKGFMDLVLCHEGRHYVMDYKSNWLGADDAAYTEDAMRAAVLAHRYDVQYTLYTFALHRLLRLRIADYDYERDVGGAAYWFLRGAGAASQGLYVDRPPRALIEALDALFAGAQP
ncbi:MAG: exodeoxyribonuclease V subunit beta [Comamonas sp.]